MYCATGLRLLYLVEHLQSWRIPNYLNFSGCEVLWVNEMAQIELDLRSLIYIQRAQYWHRYYRWFTLVTCWDWAKLPPLVWVCGVAPEVKSVRNKGTALATMAPLSPRPDCDTSSQLVWYTLTNHHNHGYAGYGKPKPRNRLLISHLRCVSLETKWAI